MLGFLAAVCFLFPTLARATERSACPMNSDPYHASSTVLQACGTSALPEQSTTKLPYGGTQYNYEQPNGQIVSLTVPPSSFDAAKASPSELETFGIPAEPPASSPEYPKWKAMISNGIHFATPPTVLYEVPEEKEESANPLLGGSTALASPPTAPSAGLSGNWSGYIDWNGKGTSNHATGYFVEPSEHTPTCEKQGSYTWAGIGGWANEHLGQDGTAQDVTGIGNHQAWWEVLPESPEVGPKKFVMPEVFATPGHWFEADTEYKGKEEYSFFVDNFANGKASHATAHGSPDANVNEFIIERPAGYSLFNFHSVAFQGYTNGKAFAQNKTEIVTLVNEKGEVNASPTAISSKYAFTDNFKSCKGIGGGGGGGGSSEGEPPAATTSSATEVAETKAKLNGTVNPKGFNTEYQFEYGTETENYSASTPVVDAGSGSSSIPASASITGLQAGTTYHFRIIANSATGITAGEDMTFKTTGTPPPPPPTVTTEGASAIAAHTSTLEATVNPNGLDTHYYFEYGTIPTLFEADAPVLPGSDAGAGSSPVHVKVGVTGLAPYTTYYYRVVANNATGTSYGVEKNFTTTATGTFSAGAYHTCALVPGGGIDCWGENYYGQLGNGTNHNNATKPVAVSEITNAIGVAAGGQHTCALLSSGKIDCWGYNKFGELGNGMTKESTTPVEVSGISTAIQVSAGYAHTCALLSSGKIDCWGENAYEQLGDGKIENSSTPVEVSGISTATSVTTGGFGTCATLSGGTVDCWGYGEFGELGNGKTENSSTPVKVSNISNAVAVTAVGYFQACAQLSSGTIDCWGDNEDGELGNGTTKNSSTPVAVSGITTGAGVAAGAFHTCALLFAKSLDCWGENYFGELGNGTTRNSTTPVAVSGITTAAGIIAGTYHTCGRLVGGSVKCWGENAFGQLGNGTTTNSTTPVEVSELP